MKAAPLHAEEARRLAALLAARILDTPAEPMFDELARLAAFVVGTPIAMVTLIDADRQWFKARVGLQLPHTPREQAFCAHAILHDEVMVVNDASTDERFHDNPLVTGDPSIRFYAGAPLVDAEGLPFGTLCVIDREPRELPAPQRAALESLAKLTMAHIQMRKSALEMADLTARVEEQTRVERMQRELVDQAVDMISVRSTDGTIASWNRGAETASGWRRDEAVGKLAHELLRTRFPQPREAIEQQLREAGAWSGELAHVRKDGTTAIVDTRWTLLREGPDAREVVLELGTDVTLRREVERLKSEFVSIVSHELRTPLTAVRGALGLLEGGMAGELAEEGRDLVGVARSNCDRLLRLINDLLDLEKMEAGRLDLRRADVELAALVDGALRSLEGFALQGAVRLRAEVTPVRMNVDPDRLVQLLTNLVSNAVKFSPHGAEVVVGNELHPGVVRLRVSDRGPGISAEQISRLFERFSQLEAADGVARGGTGLGLAISKAIAEQHGGSIGVERRDGGGTTFWVDLPLGS